MYSFRRDLETYWKKELFDVASVWKQVSEKTSKDLDSFDVSKTDPTSKLLAYLCSLRDIGADSRLQTEQLTH